LKMARTTCYSTSCRAVSIVSFDFRLPGRIQTDESLAHALGQGFHSITELPNSRWDADMYYDADMAQAKKGKLYSRNFAILSDIDEETAWEDLELSKTEAEAFDRELLLICRAAAAAIHKQGLKRADISAGSAGVFLGVSSTESSGPHLRSEVGSSRAAFQGRPEGSLARQLGATGPNMAIDSEEASGQVAVDTAYMYLQNNACSPYAITGCTRLLLSPMQVLPHCLRGSISRLGQCRVFDASCDGEVLGEGAFALVLSMHKLVPYAEPEQAPRGIIVGSAMSSEGQQADAAGRTMATVLMRAYKPHSITGAVIDAFEANAKGHTTDAVEYKVLERIASSSEEDPSIALVRSSKPSFGNSGSAAGVCSIVKSCVLMDYACHSPCILLHTLLDIESAEDADDDELQGVRTTIATEMLEARHDGQLVGVSSFSTSGTRVHTVVLGFARAASEWVHACD